MAWSNEAHPPEGVGTLFLERGNHLGDGIGKVLALAGRDPAEPDAVGIKAHLLEDGVEDGDTAAGFEVAGLVVAVAGVAAADEDAIGAFEEGLGDVDGVEAAGAHEADDADVGRVLDARGAGKVGAGVGAPVAQKGDDPRFEFGFGQ